MKLLFENKTIVTKEIFNDFGQKAFKVYSKIYRFFSMLGCIVSILLSVLIFIIDGLSISFALVLLCLIIFLFVFFKGYVIKLASSYKNFKMLNGESPQITFSFYQEKIEIVSSISTLSLEYSKITKILETDKLIILMIGKQGLMIYKAGFTVGNIDTFRSFIIEKCQKNIV